MAKNYSRGRSAYRMTARRKAALRKAQLASAKKRKRNKKIAVGVGVLGVSAVVAYGGYAHGDKISNIAKDLKRRTPKAKAAAAASAAVRNNVQTWVKEKNQTANSMSQGWVKGAGPDAGQSAPNPRPEAKPAAPPRPRNTTITKADRARAQAERERLAEEDAKNKSVVFGEGPAHRKDEWGNGKDHSDFGIPGAVKRGTTLSGKKISSLVDSDQSHKASLGVHGQSREGREEIVDHFVEEGTARGTYQGKLSNSWGKIRQPQSAKKRAAKRERIQKRKAAAARRRASAEQALKDNALNQFIQDFE